MGSPLCAGQWGRKAWMDFWHRMRSLCWSCQGWPNDDYPWCARSGAGFASEMYEMTKEIQYAFINETKPLNRLRLYFLMIDYVANVLQKIGSKNNTCLKRPVQKTHVWSFKQNLTPLNCILMMIKSKSSPDPKAQPLPLSMKKLIILILLAAIATCIILNGIYLYQYMKISSLIKTKQYVGDYELAQSLIRITSSYTFPYRSAFYQELLLELVKLSSWQVLMEKAEEALTYESNRQKFSIYYHKSMAQCVMNRFLLCKKSAVRAFELAAKEEKHYLKEIFDILISNNVMKPHEIPSQTQNEQQNTIKQEQKKSQTNEAHEKEILSVL